MQIAVSSHPLAPPVVPSLERHARKQPHWDKHLASYAVLRGASEHPGCGLSLRGKSGIDVHVPRLTEIIVTAHLDFHWPCLSFMGEPVRHHEQET